MRTLRRYVAEGEIHPERVPCLGGFRFSFSGADIQRAREVAALRMSELSARGPGLCRWHVDQAAAQGRMLPGLT